MKIWLTGTVNEILDDTERSRLFTIETDEGEKLIMSARNSIGITQGETNQFECELFATSRHMPSGKEIFRNHINVKSVLPVEKADLSPMILQAFQDAQEKRRANA